MDSNQSAMYGVVAQDEFDSKSPSVVEKIPKQMVLIQLIAQEEALFNHQHEDYRNALKKENVWRKIARKVGWTEQHCKSKWKAMRDQYCRELKRSRSNPNASIRWKYYPHMDFLRPHALYRRSLFSDPSSYRPKISSTENSRNEDNSQQEEISQDDEMTITNDELYPMVKVKSENWKMCSTSGETFNSTSEVMVEIHPNVEGETPQDDEDDDPIHTFLNIESYFENELITLIKAERVLYNIEDRAYRNVKLKQEIWEQIARKLKRTVRQCRTKWKALRDQYIREYKRLHGSDNSRYFQRWKHYEAMSFLESYIRQRNRENGTLESLHKLELNISNEDLDQEQMITESAEEDHGTPQFLAVDQETSQICMKSNYSKRCDEEDTIETDPIEERTIEYAANDADDEVGAFFRALAMKIRNAKMPTIAFTELQIDILQVITKALRN